MIRISDLFEWERQVFIIYRDHLNILPYLRNYGERGFNEFYQQVDTDRVMT